MLPAEVRFDAPRVVAYTEATSNAGMEDSMDLLDEAGDIAAARSAVYQQGLRNYHNCRVRNRAFAKGDLMLRLKQDSHNKLEPPWEGPYVIHEVIPGGAYRLASMETRGVLTNPWNIAQLRRFYT